MATNEDKRYPNGDEDAQPASRKASPESAAAPPPGAREASFTQKYSLPS